HGDGEIDGVEHGDGASGGHGRDTDLLGIESESPDRRVRDEVSDERRDEEADTKPLDAQDWEANRGAEEQEERPEQEAPPASTGEMTHERGSQAEADEYQWHTGRKREHGSDDAVEFIDVVKAFGRNRVLN